MRNICAIGLLSAIVLVLTSCAGMRSRSLNFDPYEPIRVAVVPFSRIDETGSIVQEGEIPFQTANRPELQGRDAPPSVLVQRLVYGELRGTAFDVVPAGYVRAQLVHHGLTANGTYDYARLLTLSPQTLGELFSADALLYGTVTEWDQTYYGLQSVSSVGIRLELVRARDGKVLFQSAITDSTSRGISKGPTGYSSLVIEPLWGLRDEVILELARNLVRESLTPLLIVSRQGYKESEPPVIIGATHDAPGGSFSRSDGLTVLAIGTRAATAVFSIGNQIRDIPMIEVEPGHYLGEYFPLETDTVQREWVTVTMTDQFDRPTSRRVGVAPVTLE